MALRSSQFDLMTSMHPDRSWAFLFHPLIPVILRLAWTSSCHLSLGLSTFAFPSIFESNTSLGILLFSFLIKWSSHSSLLSLMSDTTSMFWYKMLLSSFVLIRQIPLSQIGQYIFPNILLKTLRQLFIKYKTLNVNIKVNFIRSAL